MKTDDLIRALSADAGEVSVSVARRLMVALPLAIMVSAVLFQSTLGVRPDIAVAVHNPFFLLKFVLTLTLAGTALWLALRTARPQWLGAGLWLLVAAPVIVAIAIAVELPLPHVRTVMERLVGSNSRICLTAIPLLSLPILAAALLALRTGATSRPTLAGAIAGVMSAGFAATLYAAHCTDDSPLFVATWYTLAISAIGVIGALIGRRVLRY